MYKCILVGRSRLRDETHIITYMVFRSSYTRSGSRRGRGKQGPAGRDLSAVVYYMLLLLENDNVIIDHHDHHTRLRALHELLAEH
jgi:hypothetical protein